MPECRFRDGPAIGRWRLSEGCVAFPADREQDLCLHHARRARALETFELVDDYTEPAGLRITDIMSL